MSGTFKQSGNIILAILSYLALQLLRVVGFFSPSWSAWSKRLFFILATYHELQRHSLFANLPLDRVNKRLLKIKQPTLLTRVSEFTQWDIIHLDIDGIRSRGVDLEAIANGQKITARELEIISKSIIESTPAILNYGRQAMYTDLSRLLCQDNVCMRSI